MQTEIIVAIIGAVVGVISAVAGVICAIIAKARPKNSRKGIEEKDFGRPTYYQINQINIQIINK